MSDKKYAESLSEEEFLRQYKPKDYPRPSVTVDVLIFAADEKKERTELLLIKRKNHPYRGCWAIPGGFVDMEEDLETAAHRELWEESGAQAQKLSQLYTFGAVHRDPRMRVISVAYAGIVRSKDVRLRAGDDAAQAAWFEIEEKDDHLFLKERNGTVQICYQTRAEKGICISQDALAFDHFDIVQKGLQWLKQQ